LFSYFKLQSFLKQRLNEYHVNETILMTFIMQNAPASIQKTNENGKKKIKQVKKITFTLVFHLRFKNFFEKC